MSQLPETAPELTEMSKPSAVYIYVDLYLLAVETPGALLRPLERSAGVIVYGESGLEGTPRKPRSVTPRLCERTGKWRPIEGKGRIYGPSIE